MENSDEQAKQHQQEQKRLPFNMLEQADADHALATALQEQESAFTMLETIGSDVEDEGEDDDEEEEAESSSSNGVDDNYESQDFYELEFLGEDEDGSESDEVEEDEIDPDDMSYEELLALGEVVGEESRGLSIDQIASSLSPYIHESIECKTTIDRCVICQIDYEKGEHLVALHCEHPFHFECINQWLQIKKVCPICSIEITPLSSHKNI